MAMGETFCRYCGRRILLLNGVWTHLYGSDGHIMRCDTKESNRPYGFEATP